MTRVGRKPQGCKLIDELSADESCKARLKAFFETMSGQITVDEACQRLQIGPSRFFVLRNDWLQEAVDLLAPKPLGRPAKAPLDDPQVAELKEQLREFQQRALRAELRAELAEAATESATSTPPPRRKKGAPR